MDLESENLPQKVIEPLKVLVDQGRRAVNDSVPPKDPIIFYIIILGKIT
ncbi:MAG: hypothetical protein AB7V56_06925 [Candidatus Nitrosocosmicus sp.]